MTYTRLWRAFGGGIARTTKKFNGGTWSVMCGNKVEGNMRFRDVTAINKALLAKNVWHAIRFFESLVNRVLTESYFPDGNILNTWCSSHASGILREFVWEKEIITTGLRWHIGNGNVGYHVRQVDFKTYTLFPHRPPSLPKGMKVFEQKLASSDWDMNLINVMFIKEDGEAIIRIPCSVRDVPDTLIWNFSTNGKYSVQSGYSVVMNPVDQPSTSSRSDGREWWAKM